MRRTTTVGDSDEFYQKPLKFKVRRGQRAGYMGYMLDHNMQSFSRTMHQNHLKGLGKDCLAPFSGFYSVSLKNAHL